MRDFSDYKAVTLADGVEDMLLDYMKKHHVAPGDALPKEEEFAEQLQVSRHVVREGLRGLKVLGIVESRKRRGTVMRRPAMFSAFGKLGRAGLIPKSDLRGLMKMRVALELGMCTYIYQNRTQEKIEDLRTYSGGEKEYVQSLELEVLFHSKLLAIAGNDAVNEFRDILSLILDPLYVHNMPEMFSERITASHWQICDCLEHGSLEDFKKIMEDHFISYLEAV